LVGEVVEVDVSTEKKEVLDFIRVRVKIPVTSAVNLVKDISINGLRCKFSFEEEACAQVLVPKDAFGKWGGGCSEVDTDASLDEGGFRASGCDSVSLELGGEGIRVGEDVSVHGKEDPCGVGLERPVHGEDKVVGSQDMLSGVVTCPPCHLHVLNARSDSEAREDGALDVRSEALNEASAKRLVQGDGGRAVSLGEPSDAKRLVQGDVALS